MTVTVTVSSGQTCTVSSGETDINDIVLSDGTLDVLSGGIASSAIVNSGGTLELFGGGQASGTIINQGGILEFGSGYTGVGYVVSSGITLEIAAGGIASNTTVNSGGSETVLSGGVASATTLSGGTLEVASGGSTGSGPTTFTNAGGILQLDDSQHFHGLVAGFASPSGVIEEIDLRDIVFGNKTHATFKEAKNHLSGTLTVTNGTQTANLTLLGQYSTGNFNIASDGHGGTMVTDPQHPSLVGSAGSPVLAPQPT